MPRVYAKARNNDPAVPFNSKEHHFMSGKGFAVDIRVRDYNGSAAKRYAEGVIIGFFESETEARRVAEEVNSGRRYAPGHHLHTRAHSAIVIPAWNASDFQDGLLPWETREGSIQMVESYSSAGVTIPQWLSKIREAYDDASVAGEGRAVGNASREEVIATSADKAGPHPKNVDSKHPAAQNVSPSLEVPPQSRGTKFVGANEYARRLNRLFETVHPVDRGPYSDDEVAEALQADGIPLHRSSVSRLRDGTSGPPTQSMTDALAYFFDVGPEYFVDGVDFSEVIALTAPSLTNVQLPATTEKPRAHKPSRASREARKRVAHVRPPKVVGSAVELSSDDLLRFIVGLSKATHHASRQVYADRNLIRRMITLLSEAGPYLLESLQGDVPVPIRYLEHAIVDWDATSPSSSATESEYRWLGEFLNRILDK